MKCITFWNVCYYLFVAMIAFSLSSCEEGLSADQPINGGLSFNLTPVSFTSKDVSSRAGTGTTVFAGALTREQELVVHDICYFEFAGDHVAGATCLAKGYISSADLTNSSSVHFTGLTGAAGTHTLYLVANLGDVTGSVVANPAGTTGTALSALKALTFTWTTRASNDGTPYTAGTDFFLPMTGSVTVDQSGTYTTPVTTPLQRRVARVNVSIEPKASTFVLTNIKLLHVPKNGLYSAASTAYPDASVSGNFDDTGTLVDASSPSYHHTWYIPENRRSSNDNNQPVLYVSGEVNGVVVSKEIAIIATPNAVGTPTAYEILPNYEYDIRLNVSVTGIITASGVDLSLNESANSYICNKASQFYMFNATVQGNGVPTPGADGLASTTVDNNYTPAAIAPNAAYTARVLWSMGGVASSAGTDGGDASAADDGLYSVVKKGTLAYDAGTGYICFETTAATLPAQAGNAVIGLFSGGTLLWSWHIWFTDYNPDAQYDAYKTAAAGHPNPVLLMKYNLGATDQSGALSDVANVYKHGFHYQWGRKDPFLSGVALTTNCTAGTEYYYNKAAGVADFVYNGTGGSLALGYGNPMTFYTNGSSPYDWQGSTKNDLWGNPGITWSGDINPESGIKTCFDPCPPGWKVPPRGTWSAIFATTVVTSNSNVTPNASGSFSMGYNFYYTAVGSGPTTFYPASGFRLFSSGALSNVSSYGYYWCSSPDSSGSTNAGSLDFYSGTVQPLYNDSRAYGFSVRCTQK